MRLEQQLGFSKLGIKTYHSPYDDYLMTGFSGAGNPGIKPLSGSGRGNLYVRPIPSLNDELHVHPSNGYAKMNKSGQLLSNYEAAMMDLRGENEGGEARGDSW